MSKYTIEIRTMLKNGWEPPLNDYKIFNEDYRSILNEKILNHYYFYEIGFETVEMFSFYLKQKMNEIMDKYNVLYENQEKILKGMLGNVNLEETYLNTSSGKGTSSSNSKSDSEAKNVLQDTPQGQVTMTDLDNLKWATSYTKSESNASANDTSETSTNNTENYVKNIVGNNGLKSNLEMYIDFVNKFNTIDMSIINELDELFMGLL